MFPGASCARLGSIAQDVLPASLLCLSSGEHSAPTVSIGAHLALPWHPASGPPPGKCPCTIGG